MVISTADFLLCGSPLCMCLNYISQIIPFVDLQEVQDQIVELNSLVEKLETSLPLAFHNSGNVRLRCLGNK